MKSIDEGLATRIRDVLNSGDFRLPSLPDTVMQVQRVMSGEDFDIADIAKILGKDPAFATVVLRMANSVRFNTTGKEIRNLTMGIQRIGTQNIVKLLIAVASRMFSDIRHPELMALHTANQEQAMFIAAAAEQVAVLCKGANAADTFMAGLLHNIGKDVMLIAIPEELRAVSPNERQAILGRFHREMGARLLHKWSLPEEFVLTAQHHGIESGDRPRSSIIDCIDVAAAVVWPMLQEEVDIDALTGLAADLPAARRLHLNATQIAGTIDDTEQSLAELRDIFF